MPPRRNRDFPHTPTWLDTLIMWLEVIGVIGTIVAGVYATVTLFGYRKHSAISSVSDNFAALLGFLIAHRAIRMLRG